MREPQQSYLILSAPPPHPDEDTRRERAYGEARTQPWPSPPEPPAEPAHHCVSHLDSIASSRLGWHLASPLSRHGSGCECCRERLVPPAEERALGHEARHVGRRLLEQGGGARRHALAEEEEQRVQGLGAAREAVVGAHEPEHDVRVRVRLGLG